MLSHLITRPYLMCATVTHNDFGYHMFELLEYVTSMWPPKMCCFQSQALLTRVIVWVVCVPSITVSHKPRVIVWVIVCLQSSGICVVSGHFHSCNFTFGALLGGMLILLVVVVVVAAARKTASPSSSIVTTVAVVCLSLLMLLLLSWREQPVQCHGCRNNYAQCTIKAVGGDMMLISL